MHRDPRQVPCFLGILVASATAFFGPEKSVKYGIDLPFYGRMALPARLGIFVIGLSPACGLVTTLGLAIHCNTAIRSESVRCMLVTYRLLSIRPLVKTLDVVVHCNAAIRLKFVRCAILAFRRTPVYCSTIILGTAVRYDTAIRPKSFRCVLVVSRLLSICNAFHRP